MKKFLIALMIASSSIASATEVSLQELLDLYVQNKATYEDVKPGMTAEYFSNSFILIEGEEEKECRELLKEVVISTDHHDKYLVYSKKITLEDCGYTKKGEYREYLMWFKRYYVEEIVTDAYSNTYFEKIEKQGNFVNKSFYRIMEDGDVRKSKTSSDMSQSQFYSVTESQMDNFKDRLIKRSYTDPATIDISKIQLLEFKE